MADPRSHNIFLLLFLVGSTPAAIAKSTKSLMHVARPRRVHGSVSDGCKVRFGAVGHIFSAAQNSISTAVCPPAAEICATLVTFSLRRSSWCLELAFHADWQTPSVLHISSAPRQPAALVFHSFELKAKLARGDFMSFGNSRERESGRERKQRCCKSNKTKLVVFQGGNGKQWLGKKMEL